MFYDVEEISNKLNISKVTVYNKFKLKSVKPYVIQKQGKSMVDEEGLNLIKESLKLKNDIKSKEMEEEWESEVSLDRDELINLNKELINVLIEQIKEKDRQIVELHKLIENNQVLLKQQQSSEGELLLEEHFNEVDRKLMDLREELKAKQTDVNKRSLLDRILGRDKQS